MEKMATKATKTKVKKLAKKLAGAAAAKGGTLMGAAKKSVAVKGAKTLWHDTFGAAVKGHRHVTADRAVKNYLQKQGYKPEDADVMIRELKAKGAIHDLWSRTPYERPAGV
jgi:hypothetical protein